MFWTVWLVWSQSHHHLLAVFHCCAPFIGYQLNIRSISRSACWPTRLFMRNSPFPFAPWLPFLFHHVHWDQTEESLCPSLGSRPTLAQGPSAHVPLLFGTTFHYLCVQPPRLPPSEDVSKHTFSTWPSPRRHRCALLPVDVAERLQRLCIWTPIWLLRHWAWLRRGYRRYRNLIDWLVQSDVWLLLVDFLQIQPWHWSPRWLLVKQFLCRGDRKLLRPFSDLAYSSVYGCR